MKQNKIAILASGNGSNAEAIMAWAIESMKAEVVCVLSDKKKAFVIERAKIKNVPTIIIPYEKNEGRASHEKKMIESLHHFQPDWIVLAGFMRLLSPLFLGAFENRVINIHPSLLPLFPGKDAYGDAFRAKVKESGCTVHYVDEGIDTGPIIAQTKFQLIEGESLEDFKRRGLEIENQFYPQVLEKILQAKK